MSIVKIQGAEYVLSEIFSDDFVFKIPPYQRPYAWTTNEAEALFDDLIESLGNDEQTIDNVNPYFLGSIVLIKDESSEAQIIDGQQRLTTLTILLSSLRSSLSKEWSKYFLDFLYQEGNKIKGTPNLYRLSLREKDRIFFQRYIQEDGGISKLQELNKSDLTESQRLIQENATLYHERLQSMNETKRLQLAQFIVSRCFLVVVSTPDIQSAYRIFSVLNDRGKDLSRTDIFKADVIGKINDSEKGLYGKRWEEIEEDLGRANFEKFLSHIRNIFQKHKRGKNILDDLRKKLEKVEANTFFDEFFEPYSKSFYLVQNCCYSHEDIQASKEINNCLRWLSQVDKSDWIPSSIVFLSKFRNDPQKLVQFFTDLERLSVSFWIQSTRDNQRNERFGQIINHIEKNKDLFTPESPLQLSSEERKVVRKTLDGDIFPKGKLCSYILRRLDAELSEGVASYEFSNVTVEHVLPQKPAAKSLWLSWFSNANQRKKYVNRIGNLVLLSAPKNREAKNFDFSEKKNIYFKNKSGVSNFALTTTVLNENNWTPTVIEKRQKKFLEILYDLWQLL